MAIQRLDFGTAANNDGELIRTAFPKLDNNDADLDTRVVALAADVATKTTAADVNSLIAGAAGSVVQAYDADLTTWAGLTPSANAQSLVTAADYAAMRALLDLEAGTDFYSISGANAAFQPLDADLTAIGALAKTDGNVIVGDGSTWVAESGATARTSLGLGSGDSPTFTAVTIGASVPFSDSAGTLTLQNVDALDATTESTIESAIDTLVNLTSIQGRTVTLADAGADAFLAWDDSADKYQNISASDATAILNTFVGDSGSGGTKGIVPAPATGDATKFLKGDGTWAAIPGGGDALTSNPLSQFSATTSAQLAGTISDETGSGALVFATSPTLVTPVLGTPASGTLTNCTGLPVAGGGTGAANAAGARSNLGFGTAGAGNIFGAAINLGLSASVAGNALTIALKGADGNNPSATNPVLIPVRNTTDTTGTPSWLAVTAASSITVSSGSTLSTANNTAFRFHVVGFNDAGTFRMGVVHVGSAGELGADMLASSTAEGGAGAADSINTFYTGSAVTNKYYCILGYVEYSSGLATAGTYASAPTKIQIYGAGSVPPLRAPTMQTFTSSGTWTKPAGCRRIRVRVIGGGGGGAGGLGASSQIGMGSGGGSGGASVKDIDATNLNTETVTIGAAGAAGTSAPGNGGNGGTTSFGSHCSATGGSGGSTTGAGTSLTGAAGGNGGEGSGGNMNFSGGPGGPSLRLSAAGGFPGVGGTGPMGGGGNMNASIVGTGVAGGGYGGGGSGALSNTTTGYAGGAGAAGLVIVEEFY